MKVDECFEVGPFLDFFAHFLSFAAFLAMSLKFCAAMIIQYVQVSNHFMLQVSGFRFYIF